MLKAINPHKTKENPTLTVLRRTHQPQRQVSFKKAVIRKRTNLKTK